MQIFICLSAVVYCLSSAQKPFSKSSGQFVGCSSSLGGYFLRKTARVTAVNRLPISKASRYRNGCGFSGSKNMPPCGAGTAQPNSMDSAAAREKAEAALRRYPGGVPVFSFYSRQEIQAAGDELLARAEEPLLVELREILGGKRVVLKKKSG